MGRREIDTQRAILVVYSLSTCRDGGIVGTGASHKVELSSIHNSAITSIQFNSISISIGFYNHSISFSKSGEQF